jgi:hypothetical protein
MRSLFAVSLASSLATFLLIACEEASKPPQQASACSGLNQADCTAKTECVWTADKNACVAK